MRPFLALLPLLLLAAASARPDRVLWRGAGVSARAVSCDGYPEPGPGCHALVVGQGARRVASGGYAAVRLVWTRPPGGSGPDALLIGDTGGSGGERDFFAVTVAPGLRVRRWRLEHGDNVTVPRSRALRFSAPFGIGYFNGAPNAGFTAVPVTIVWRDGAFRADLAELAARRFPPEDLRFREHAIRADLDHWRGDVTGDRLFPPYADGGTETAVEGLMALMVTGHVEQARAMLGRTWPRGMAGEEDFWRALCGAMVGNADWHRLGLDRQRGAAALAAAARVPGKHPA